MTTSIRKRRAIKQRTCGTISFISSAACATFYITFAALHDMGAEPMVQACMLAAAGVALFTAIAALVVAVEA